jgi:protein-S-isoprenylcysteine O-methyltransferase Ste14
MELYGIKSRSIPQKVIIHVLEAIFLLFSYWILFLKGGNYIQNFTGIHNAENAADRRLIIFLFNIIIFLRLAFMMFYLLKRKIPGEESISVPFAFALYYIGFTLFVLPVNHAINWIDYIAIWIFVEGCFINTASELLRHIWKRKPENKGRLYTQGFFKYSMHINYFGDLLWVIAYAIITGNWYSISIPVFLFIFFIFFNIPKLDKYLKEKYGRDFDVYSKRTKKFIPFIY